MKRASFALGTLCLALNAGSAFAAAPSFSSAHEDYRHTPRFLQFEDEKQKSDATPEASARAFLAAHATEFGITSVKHELHLEKVQESLAGTHFHFAQQVDGVAVDQGEVIVSVSLETHGVYAAYNNFFPVAATLAGKTKKATLTAEQAFDAAWSDLKVHGVLQDAPKARLVYRVDGKGAFRLVYLTFLDTQAPFGAWEHEVDAETGKVLSRVDTAIHHNKPRSKVDPDAYTGPVTDRTAAFAAYRQEAEAKAVVPSALTAADGRGLVFDPDPRSTLNNIALADNSPAAMFDAAYFERTLRDLAFDGTTYRLDGPWVKIADFESPTTPPSTSTSGRWTAKRGDNAFDDAMTYFHLDQNQRYMQALGFAGAKAIQGAPIAVDTDGVNGDDNSHFIPSSNRLAFGHGCVDDDEDADVILHEYGHAINFSINPNFNGGDSGAMGEGFGDYWAASYSVSSAAGMNYFPSEVYSWDGHGVGNVCWPGRVLNATDAMYDPTRTYGAHASLGTHQTDELWSTPLFQALTALMQQGVPRSEVDQIILEAQFGLGAGLRMRDLAQATIAAAHRLQPNGPHGAVFQQKFVAQNIVEVARAVLAIDHVTYTGLGNNGVADPGEALTVRFALANRGTLPASTIRATLTSDTVGVTVTRGSLTFNDAAIGATVESREVTQVSLDDNLACGTSVRLTLTLTFAGGLEPSVVLPLDFRLGVARGMLVNVTPNMAIPDNNQTGVSVSLAVDANEAVSSNLAVDVDVQHPYVGDLTVTLTSPRGTVVKLHDKSGGSSDNLIGRYPTSLTPAQPLSAFVGQPMRGDWKLTVVDGASSDVGTLRSFGLYDIAGYECER